ncbi:M16 family metallopeptidase [Occallatibacter savannae]|uniref:M16 family metallopeptidase n=1 Tax=Occallatibacter savannae TaxID=1002691 RepID=UPI000D69302B|nr:pitrilysin family protein [Occallatibacter savannae]
MKSSDQLSVFSGQWFSRFACVLLGGALALSVMPRVCAQENKPWEKIPIPQLHQFKPQQPKRVALKNGIVLFLQEDHELPFVSGSVLIPGGSRDEDAAKCGLVDLYGQTWRTSGTEKLNGDAMDDLLEAKAAHIETGGDLDSTALSWESLKADKDQVYDLAMDLLFHPKFDQQKLRLAQQQDATGIVRRNDDEGQIAGREAMKLVYGADSPYARQPELSTISKVTVADLQAWHDRSLGGKLIVAVSGDFDSAAMEAKLRATFEKLPTAKPNPPNQYKVAGPTPGVYFVNKEDVNQSNVQIVGVGLDRHNPDVPSVAMMNDVFGGGFSSRLFQTVRTRYGLAYAVGGGLSFAWDHPGTFDATVMPRSDKTVEAIQRSFDVMTSLVSQPFTEDELKRAKDNILNSFLFRYDTKAKVLAERVRLEFYGYPPDYLETYKAALEKVTVADLNAAAKKYIHPDKYAVLVVGNKSEINPGLDTLKMGPVHDIDITIPGTSGGGGGGAEKEQ